MRAFFLAWTKKVLAQPVRESGDSGKLAPLVREIDNTKIPKLVTEIPWGHNVIIIEKLKNPVLRLWYAQKTIEHGWSRAEEEDFYIDLLFYHLRLKCFIVIDLKMEPFKPEFAGKMNFYLSVVDEQLRQDGDNPGIGIILCKTRKKLIAEYTLRNTNTPIGVSEYKLTRIIPPDLQKNLPSIRELEKELGRGG